MVDERAIGRMEELLVEVTRLGGQNEQTSIVSNLVVVDASPPGLTGFITITDERDGDTILAKTVPGIIYAVSDKVNVLFVEGTEPIAFQQGSESPSAGLWGIVPSTSTDIFYNNGDVGIGKSVAPDSKLEILDAAQAQLRLTNIEDTTFVDLTLDASHDLTIKPSSIGQIIFQPTTDSTDFFQVLDADGGTPVLNVDSTNERVGIGIAAPVTELDVNGDITLANQIIHAGDADNNIAFTDDVQTYNVGGIALLTLTEAAQDLINLGPGSGDVDIDFNGDAFILGSTGNFGVGTNNPQSSISAVDDTQAGVDLRTFNDAFGSVFIGQTAGGTEAAPTATGNGRLLMRFSAGGHTGAAFTFAQAAVDMRSSEAFTATNQGTNIRFSTTPIASITNTEVMRIEDTGDVGIGTTNATAQLHVDQSDTGGAQPVATFDQADVSEEIFEFISTIGVGNAIEAIGAKTLTTTHFIKVTIPGGLTRYFPVGTIA